MERWPTMSFMLPDGMRDDLRSVRQETGKSMSELIREGIEVVLMRYVQGQDKKVQTSDEG